jgi:Glycosyltransferase family 87
VGSAYESSTWRKRLFWLVAAALVTVVYGPPFRACFRTTSLRDFVQEWASARNCRTGRPIYEPQETSLAHHMGYARRPNHFFLERNLHPPTSVLLAIPLSGLCYRDAFFAWNLLSLLPLAVSLYLTARALGIPLTPWSALPIYTLLLVCNPLHQQLLQGQLNLVLLLLIVGVWWADRTDRPVLAGLLLGAATTIKLYPAFLFLYFVLQRRSRSIAAGAASIIALTLLTVAILGIDSYRDYLVNVIPTLGPWRSSWPNVSLPGFWTKLFDPDGNVGMTVPLVRSRAMAVAGTWISCALVAAATGVVVRRARSRLERDWAFATCITAMLLVTPIVWDHYFLLLLLPVALLWTGLPRTGPARWDFRLILFVLWVTPSLWFHIFLGVDRITWTQATALPWQTLTALSFQTYALLGLFLLGLRCPVGRSCHLGPDAIRRRDSRRPIAPSATLEIVPFVHC